MTGSGKLSLVSRLLSEGKKGAAVSDEEAPSRQKRKDAWIAAARATFNPSDRQPCNICRRFAGIAQAHHVIPLAIQFDHDYALPDHEHVWLCPNHHAIAHAMIADRVAINTMARSHVFKDEVEIPTASAQARLQRGGPSPTADLQPEEVRPMLDLVFRAEDV